MTLSPSYIFLTRFHAYKGLKLSKNMFYVHIYGVSDVDEDDAQ